MKKVYFLFSLLLLAGQLRAQDYQVTDLTLQECIEIALENNINLQRTELNLANTEAALLEARGNVLPSFSFGFAPQIRWGRNINPVTNLFETRRIGAVNMVANSNVTLFAGRQIQNSINQALTNVEASQFDVEASRNDITLTVINLFVNVVFAKEQLNIAQSQLKTVAEQRDRTTRLVEAGSLPTAERLDIEAQTATSELEVINASNNLRLARLNLAQMLQVPFSNEFDISFPDLEAEDYNLAETDVNQIFAIALETMPQVRAAGLGVEASEFGVKAAKGGFYPTLSLGGNVFSNYIDQPSLPNFEINPFFQQIENNLAQQVTLNLNIPVFSNFRNRANLQRARVQRRMSELQQVETQNQLRQDIETAFTNAMASRQAYRSSQRRVSSLEEAFRMSQQRYDVGGINAVDFQIAQNNLFNAQADLINAKYEYIFRVKVLDFYLGNPISL
ncbi:TolC family protein [Litoribacter ruber]|uniref:TolC family protein n=1 Tax=Litoribacter ruber TaxID=702568 RepID=UPI001BDA02A8|nr:TolC family protein [Litoribacter ruber]MBT0812590.1 TolC family protein [Litoribacter ruber]